MHLSLLFREERILIYVLANCSFDDFGLNGHCCAVWLFGTGVVMEEGDLEEGAGAVSEGISLDGD